MKITVKQMEEWLVHVMQESYGKHTTDHKDGEVAQALLVEITKEKANIMAEPTEEAITTAKVIVDFLYPLKHNTLLDPRTQRALAQCVQHALTNYATDMLDRAEYNGYIGFKPKRKRVKKRVKK